MGGILTKATATNEDAGGLSSITAATTVNAALPDLRKTRYVVDSALVSFTSSMSSQHKEDVLDSLLLAQLAATKQYNPLQDPKSWYQVFTDTLSKVGWVIRSLDFNSFTLDSDHLDVDSEVLGVISSEAAEAGTAAAGLVKALEGLPQGDARVTLFNTASDANAGALFQLCPCYLDGSSTTMVLGGYYFTTAASPLHFLRFNYALQRPQLFCAAMTAVLDESVYSQVRAQVRAKLDSQIVRKDHMVPL